MSDVILQVYTSGMRKVREVHMGPIAAGSGKLTASGAQLQGLAKGVYFTVIEGLDAVGNKHKSAINRLMVLY